LKTVAELNDIVRQVRRDIVRMVHAIQSGHPGGSLGCTEYFTVLYHNTMKYSAVPFNMEGKNEDVFILSNGHISPVFYSTLAHAGYFDKSELATFRKLDSRLQGHPATEEGLPGIRIASGSLGQGLSVAVGLAQSKKLATVDFNLAQIDGSTTDIMGFHELNSKFEAFGWDVMEMDGNDVESVNNGLLEAKNRSANGKPVVIIMKTEMGNGVDFMMGSHKWHGIPPNDEQLESALSQNSSSIGDY